MWRWPPCSRTPALRFITAVRLPRNTENARFMVANVNIDYLAQADHPGGLQRRVGALPGGRGGWSLRGISSLLQDGRRGRHRPRRTIAFTDGERPMPIELGFARKAR